MTLREHLEVDRVLNVTDLAGAVMLERDGDTLYAVRAYGEDYDEKAETSVALVFLGDELAVVCAKIARMMIDAGESEILLDTWQKAMLGPRVN